MGQTKQYISTPLFIALTFMAMSLPLSLFMMSLMQFVLVGLWAFEGFYDSAAPPSLNNKQNILRAFLFPFNNIKRKIKPLESNKIALVLFSFYLIPLCGLLFTNDFNRALNELRTYLPILVLTLVIASSKPLSKNQLNSLLLFYIAAVISATFFGLYKFIGQEFSDIRELSIFIHPTRLSLNICFSIFLMVYFIFKNEFKHSYFTILFSISIIWLIYFLILMESGMGLSALFIIGISLLLYNTTKLKTKVKYVFLVFAFLIPLMTVFYTNKIVREYYKTSHTKLQALDLKSSLGNPYIHDTINYDVEGGRHIGLYICETELKNSWENRSNLAFEGKDLKGQELKKTLIRFLTSLDLRKDASGMEQLTNDHILAIEKGIANINYLENPGIKTRIYKILIGYENYKKNDDPNGNSLIQRIEYWKASIDIITMNFWTGVGTGDIRAEFDSYYLNTNSKLKPENRGISHNQYLNFMVSFGIFGGCWFLFVLFYPLSFKIVRTDYYYIIFISIVLISMLTIDTIKNQAGISFFCFFNTLFLFGRKSKTQIK